jgi:hypothetical protein
MRANLRPNVRVEFASHVTVKLQQKSLCVGRMDARGEVPSPHAPGLRMQHDTRYYFSRLRAGSTGFPIGEGAH